VTRNVESLKKIWQDLEEPALMFAAAAVSAGLVLVTYTIFTAFGSG